MRIVWQRLAFCQRNGVLMEATLSIHNEQEHHSQEWTNETTAGPGNRKIFPFVIFLCIFHRIFSLNFKEFLCFFLFLVVFMCFMYSIIFFRLCYLKFILLFLSSISSSHEKRIFSYFLTLIM